MATKMFVHYNGTVNEFKQLSNIADYNNKIVFIKGGENGKGAAVYTHGSYFANFEEFLAAVNYVKGVNVNGTNYNAAAGGGYVAFGASDPATVAVNAGQNGITIGLTEAFVAKVNNTATALGNSTDAADEAGSAFARIANLASLVSDLTGGTTTSIGSQINNAINALRSEITGDLTDATDSKTLEAINDELNAIDAKWASYVSKAELEAIGDTKADGVNVNVSVTTAGGKVTAVAVNEQGLSNALALKANVADVYDKTAAESMAQGKVDALANSTVKANTDAIAILNGNNTVDGSVAKQIKDAINAFAGSADNDNVIENVTELLNYVSGVDGSKDLTSAIAQIDENKGKIATLNGDANTAGSVAKAVKDAVDTEVSRAEATYAIKGTETVASNAASRANEAYALAETKVTADEAKAQAVAAIGEIAEVSKNSDNTYVNVTVKTKSGSVSEVSVDDAGVKTYADGVAATAKSEAITEAASAAAVVLQGYYTKTEVDAMWMWEELE